MTDNCRYISGLGRARRPPSREASRTSSSPARGGAYAITTRTVSAAASPFPSKSAVLAYYRDVIEPRLRGEPEPLPELTFGEFVPLYLERHAAGVRSRTIETLRRRLCHQRDFGTERAAAARVAPSEASLCATSSGCPARSPPGEPSCLRGPATARCRCSHRRSAPRSAGATWLATRPSSRDATRGRLRGRSASTRATSSRRSPPSWPRYRPLPAFAAATGYGRRNRPCSSATTSIVESRLSRLAARSPQVRSSSWPRQPRSPRGPAVRSRARCARRAAPSARQPVPVRRPPRRSVRPRQLPPS
jgi:hypothetical protein